MVSNKQLAANQQNAQSSTGPKDTTITRYNATRHGVFSSATVIDAVDGEGAHDIHAELVARVWREVAPVGIIEEEYAGQLVDVIWRRRRFLRWEAATIQSDLSPAISVPRRKQQTLSPALRVLLDVPSESSSPELQETEAIGPVDGASPNGQDQELEQPRAGVFSDPDLNKLLRYDTYLSNKLGKICRELQRLQEARSDRSSRATSGPVSGPPAAEVPTEESPAPIEPGVAGAHSGLLDPAVAPDPRPPLPAASPEDPSTPIGPGVAGAYSDSKDDAMQRDSRSRTAFSSPGRSSMTVGERFKRKYEPSADRKNGK